MRMSSASVNPDLPIPISVAIVLDGDRVLVGKRAAEAALGGYAEFPGGKVEAGESPESAAIRECREETGLEVEVTKRLDSIEYQYDHAKVAIEFFLCELADSKDSTDSTKSRGQQPQCPFTWVPLNQLGEHSFPPANQAVVRRLLAG